MKKAIALLLAVLMTVGMFAGCSSKQAVSEETKAPAANSAEKSPESAAPAEEKEPITIRVAYEAEANNPGNPAEMEICQQFAERLGVTIEWLDWGTDMDTYREKLELSLNGGNAPDIFMIHGPDKVKAYVADDLLLCIEDYWDNYPNVKAWNSSDEIRENITYSADGKIYTTVRQHSDVKYNMALEARTDIIKENNLSYDGTIESLTQLMRDMKEISGADYAFTFRHGAHNLVAAFAGTFGIGTDPLGWNTFAGKYDYHGSDDRLFNELVWLNQLFEEGLLDPEYALNTTDMAVEKMTNGNAVMWYDYFKRCDALTNPVREADPSSTFEITPIAMPVTADGYKPATHAVGRIDTSYQIGINADTEYPEICMAFLDMLFTDETITASNYGVEGVSYTVEADGSKSFIDGVDVNLYSADRIPIFKNVVDIAAYEVSEYGTYGYEGAMMYKANNWLNEYKPETPLEYFTDEEQAELVDCDTLFWDYYSAEIQNFIEGKRPLTAEEYAKFQQELAENGGARWCEIQNNAYNAWKN